MNPMFEAHMYECVLFITHLKGDGEGQKILYASLGITISHKILR